MVIETLYDKDGSINALQGKTVAVLGYGSQGHAHAQNLRDSGVNVIVANRRESANGKLAVEHGFDPLSVDEAVKRADLVIFALPDEVQPEVYEKIRKGLKFDTVVQNVKRLMDLKRSMGKGRPQVWVMFVEFAENRLVWLEPEGLDP